MKEVEILGVMVFPSKLSSYIVELQVQWQALFQHTCREKLGKTLRVDLCPQALHIRNCPHTEINAHKLYIAYVLLFIGHLWFNELVTGKQALYITILC